MAAVVAPTPSGGLLQRRLSQAQSPCLLNMAGFMDNYNMNFKSSMAAPEPMLRPQSMSLAEQASFEDMSFDMSNINFFCPPNMASNAMPYMGGPLAIDTTFTNPYNLASTFNGTVPAMPQMDQIPAWQPSFDCVSLDSAHNHTRNNSLSSFSSSPVIKSEGQSPIQPSQMFYDASAYSSQLDSSPTDSDDGSLAAFSTDVDTLMKAIQAKANPGEQQKQHRTKKDAPRQDSMSPTKLKKRYQCTIEDCNKSFYQKTHLEIHTRAHTGVKPFVCKEPTCGQRFSQLGNLKTHERRHTGERPYKCDICDKTFAQRGNVRAHKIVHTSAKPFTCKLDACNKQFTQLGNLKSHQNKFHTDTIRNLKHRFETMREGDVVSSWEKEMWEYFGSLYKNCNKGIKGRGKDRRISSTGQIIKTEDQSSRRNSYASSTSDTSAFSGMEPPTPVMPAGAVSDQAVFGGGCDPMNPGIF